jgi:hypothetical protein
MAGEFIFLPETKCGAVSSEAYRTEDLAIILQCMFLFVSGVYPAMFLCGAKPCTERSRSVVPLRRGKEQLINFYYDLNQCLPIGVTIISMVDPASVH